MESAAVAYSMMGPGKRCKQKTSHHRLLQKWRTRIVEADEAADEVGSM